MKKILLVVLVIITSACSVQDDTTGDLDIDLNKPKITNLSGYAEIVEEAHKSVDGRLQFTVNITATQNESASRIFVYVDAVPVPFSVNDGAFDYYYDILADGKENTLQFVVNVEDTGGNKTSKLSISRVSSPLNLISTNNYTFFAGAVIDFDFLNTNTSTLKSNLKPLPTKTIDTLNKELKDLIDENQKEEPFVSYVILNDGKLTKNFIVSNNPSLVFYNPTKHTEEIVFYILKDDRFYSMDQIEGYTFSLEAGKSMELSLDNFDLEGSSLTLHWFMGNRLQSSNNSYYIE